MFLLEITPPPNADHLWETIVTILFTLSLISERIGNFIKLQFSSLSITTFEVETEKKRESRILLISLACGIVTAVLAGADFFTLLKEGSLINLSDVGKNGSSIVKPIIGLILSGIFISLGSKFWHDVLDIVLQFSNLKKYKVKEKMQAAKAMDTAAKTGSEN